jgi:hypothetical protein
MNKFRALILALGVVFASDAFSARPCTQTEADKCKCGSGYTCYAWGNEIGCNSSNTTDGIANGTYHDCRVGFKPLSRSIKK